MRSSNSGFEHASAPYGDALRLAEVVDRQRFAETAHAADFDVDDSAGSRFHSGSSYTGAFDRFVQAYCGAQFLLQARVIVDVVIPQRLLDHEEIELIELSQVLHLVERVGGVRIAAQRDVGPA